MPQFKLKAKAGPHQHTDGVWYERGDIITCEEDELGIARDKFDMIYDEAPKAQPSRRTRTKEVPKDEIKEVTKETPKKPVGGLILSKAEEEGLYDVVNPATGDKINEEPLSKKDAESFTRDYET